jgi:probable HAF family extracellular repeat protein
MNQIVFRISLAFMLATPASYAQSASSGPGVPHYTVTDLGLVGGPPGQPFVIRNSGLIAGSIAAANQALHAVLWYQGAKYDIGQSGLGGPNNLAFGVNEVADTVGQAETADFDPDGEDFCGFGTQRVCHPFVWQNGRLTPLVTLRNTAGAAGTSAIANSINNRGQIVGVAENGQRDSTCPSFSPTLGQYQQFQFKPAIWEYGTLIELPTVSGDPDGIAFAINDRGQVVGASGTCTSFQANGDLTYLYGLHATLWLNGTVTDLGNLGGIAPGGGNTAININNQGQVVGSSGTPDGSFHAFLWSASTGIQDLGAVEDDIASVALGINDKGDISGISFDMNFNPRAFVRTAGGVPADLNSMISGDSPLFLFDACSINSTGQIIGIAIDEAGEFHGYLASPSTQQSGSAVVHAANRSIQFERARRLLRTQAGSGRFGKPIAPR